MIILITVVCGTKYLGKTTGPGDLISTKMAVCSGVAHAIGYLHAKDIVHGRISSKNVFLEPKVQLSLLDYAGDQSNIIYQAMDIAR